MTNPRPVRMQRRRTRGYDMQAESRAVNGLPALYVGRPGRFGNPFIHHDPAEAVAAYRRLCQGGMQEFLISSDGLSLAHLADRPVPLWDYARWMSETGIYQIRGHNLACWCPLDQPCHADVLLEIAYG